MSSPFSAKTDSTKPRTVTDRVSVSTSDVKRDYLMTRGLYIIKAVYDNRDGTNVANLRTDPNADQVEVSANAVGSIEDEIFSYIEVSPDSSTGNGLLTLTLASPDELRRLGFIE